MSYDDAEKDTGNGVPRNSVDDLEDCPLTGEEQDPSKRQHRKNHRRWFLSLPPKESVFWRLWSLSTTVFCFILLLVLVHDESNSRCEDSADTHKTRKIADYPHPVETWKQENLVETKFYRDLRYMTLDHDADYLWKEHELMSTGNIRIPDGEGSKNTSLMSISMWDYPLTLYEASANAT